MQKTNFFYSEKDIKAMKELIRTGEPLLQIAKREHNNFNASLWGFYTKICSVAKKTTKIRKWEGPLRVRSSAKSLTEHKLPEGFTFDGTPKKVTFCVDHFRVYF